MMSNLHWFSDGQTHVVFDPETLNFYRMTELSWTAREWPAAGDPPSPARASAPALTLPGEAQPALAPESWVLERLVMIVTTHCNLRCRYCYADEGAYGLPRQQMSADLARRALDWIQTLFSGIGFIQFFGGEPSFNCETMQAVCETLEQRHAVKQILALPQYALVTNGTVLPDQLKTLIQRYRIHLTYSIDGPAEVHNINRFYADGRGSFQDAFGHFKQLQKEGKGSIGVEMTFSPQALEAGWGIWELAQFSRSELGVEPHIAPVAAKPGDVTGWNGNLDVAATSYRKATATSLQSLLDEQYVGFSFATGILRTLITKRPRTFICPAGVGTLAVNPQGDVHPCFMFAGQPELSLGNVNSTPDRKIFLERLQAFVQTNRKDTHPACRECWARNLCSGCMGDIQLSSGVLEGESPLLCAVMKSVAEEAMLFLARIQSDPALWKRFVNNYRRWRLDQLNPVQEVV